MGLNLITAREDFEDRRQRILSLTTRGRQVAKTVVGILTGNDEAGET
jgi:DNA-binding MarR family transcriptional regulator